MSEKEPAKVALGGRIRQLREKAGLSREQMAKAAGVSVRAIVQWELGEREPGWFNIVSLADALGVNCLAFTDGAEGQPAETRGPGRPPKRKAGAGPRGKKRKGK